MSIIIEKKIRNRLPIKETACMIKELGGKRNHSTGASSTARNLATLLGSQITKMRI